MFMKNILITVSFLALLGCAHSDVATTTLPVEHSVSCLGDVNLPEAIANNFDAVDDDALLSKTLDKPENGKLCQGQVYKSKDDTQITIYRAWNSTNPGSKLGKWWAFDKPAGKTSKYRSDYEICYQWSPLDKMVSCTLKADTKIVVGTGQSAKCSEYLTYPVSSEQQVYIDDAQDSVLNCTTFDDEFSWQ